MLPIFYGYGFALVTAVIIIAADLIFKIAADQGRAITHPLVL